MSQSTEMERYSMADPASPATSSPSISEGDIPALVAFMGRGKITDTATGVRLFLQARAGGMSNADPGALTADDLPKLEQYRARHGLQYEVALERYKADKRAGLHCT